MSTLEVQNITDGTKTVSVDRVLEGTVSAHASLRNDASIDNSFNVSSTTDNATGEYSVTPTNAFAVLNETTGMCSGYSTPNAIVYIVLLLTTRWDIEAANTAGTAVDRFSFSYVIGDLA